MGWHALEDTGVDSPPLTHCMSIVLGLCLGQHSVQEWMGGLGEGEEGEVGGKGREGQGEQDGGEE